MRGKVCVSDTLHHERGITPAYAGKSVNSVLSYALHEDHPRLCGEKSTKADLEKRVAGSPPPMRGKEKEFFPHVQIWGITPAYAGKSFRFGYIRDIVRDHPRLCGEKLNFRV